MLVEMNNNGDRENDSRNLISNNCREHCHAKFYPQNDNSAVKKLIAVAILTLIFMCGEFTGGFLANSLAIMSDAAHMLTDFASFLISLFSIWVARRQPTKRFSFGFYRAEVLGALLSIMVIWVLTGILVYLAVLRVIDRDYQIEANAMLITSGCAVLFNIIMGCVLHHGHHHGHSHGGFTRINEYLSNDDETGNESTPGDFYAESRPRTMSLVSYTNQHQEHINKQKNINVRAAFIHVLGDFVQSVGVFVAALIVKFKPGWSLADPICTFLFSVLVLITTFRVIRDILHVLMEGTPHDVSYNGVRGDLSQISGVTSVHSLHMWCLTMDKAALAVHLAIDPSYDALAIMNRASKIVRYKYNVLYCTIQVEPYDHNVMQTCKQCCELME